MLVVAAPFAYAQTTAYKCVSRGTVTYSQVPCPGARPVAPRVARTTDRARKPPQDRAKIARRAALSAEARQECGALDVTMREHQRVLKAKGDAVRLEDEMPLVRERKRFRELRC